MTKKDIAELKRRFKKDECTFTRMSGCYVDCEKNIVLKLSETFLNLEDIEYYKYLEIAKKTLSGTLGNNLLELDFPLEQEKPGNRQQSLLALKESKLKNEDLLDSFYNLVIENYEYAGNYLILLFHDAYDVMTKTSDNLKLDESEEVYEYLLCAICPVTLSKPALGYLESENRIGPRNRDWVVSAPENGFLFPAFTNRSSDIHSLLYYTKNPKEPQTAFMEAGLGCNPVRTATEQKVVFDHIVCNALGIEDKKDNHLLLEIQEQISNLVQEQEEQADEEPVLLTTDTMQEILEESGIPEEASQKIEQTYREHFTETPIIAEALIDQKALAIHAQKKKEMELTNQVKTLKEELDLTKKAEQAVTNYDVFVRVKPEKVTEITSQLIDGKKYILIPLEDNEQANVNGLDTDL